VSDTPRTDAAITETVDEFGSIGPQHRILVNECLKLERESRRLRELLSVMTAYAKPYMTQQWQIAAYLDACAELEGK